MLWILSKSNTHAAFFFKLIINVSASIEINIKSEIQENNSYGVVFKRRFGEDEGLNAHFTTLGILNLKLKIKYFCAVNDVIFVTILLIVFFSNRDFYNIESPSVYDFEQRNVENV